jgi:DNA repair exonuclease SbcCD ATPase subunit
VPDRERVLSFLHELERADQEVEAVLAELDGLAREIDSVRSTVSRLADFEQRLPSERERLAADLGRAKAEVAAAEDALRAAESAVASASEDSGADAQRFEVRARDRLSVGERRAAEAETGMAAFEQEAEEAQRAALELEEKARRLAATLRGRPRFADDAGRDPRPGLEGIAEWSETARAALFVARGQLTAEREAVIRQANELGALTLGEPLTSLGTARVTQRVEEKFGER